VPGATVVTLDASGGDETESLPSGTDGDTLVAVRVDDSSNAATVEVADTGSETIERLEEQSGTSVDLAVEEALYLTYNGSVWYQVRPPLHASAEPVTTDQATKDSPPVELVGTYDEESGTGVTSAQVEAALRHEVTGIDTAPTPSEPTSRVHFEIAGTKVATLDDGGNFVAEGDVTAFGSKSGSGGGGLAGNDPVSLDTSVDPTEINFIQDIKDGGGATVVQGATEIQFKGSGLGDVSNPSGGRVEVEITGGPGGISDIQDDGTSVVSDAKTLDFGTGLDVTNPTTDEAEVDVSLAHSDLSGISSDDHHTRPSAGDGLSESSNAFTVNESQVDHNSLNQYVANEHIDHSTVSVSTGARLSGGGDLTASRTLFLSGPLTDIPFKTAGDNLEWQADGNNDLILQNTSDGKKLLTIDQDSGALIAEGDVSAFGSAGGSGGGGTEFQAGQSLSLDSTTDPDTLNVDLVGGTNVSLSTDGNNNYVIDVPNAGAVDSVFGRTGDVNALSGDYSHSQISGISTDDHHIRPSAGDGLSESSDTFSVNESEVDHDSLSGYVANEHVDHSTVSILAGTALSGGGDLTSSRTLSLSGPLTGVPFKTQGDNLEWQANADDDLVLKNTTDNQVLLTVNQDTGSLTAEGDVAAFGSGTGSGGGTEFQAGRSLSLDSGTDPDTLDVTLVGGTNVTLSTNGNDNYVIDVPDAGAVDSVFGRTGAVAAQSGDYDHSQLAAISSDDHHTKTTSASGLTNVSPDSDREAHHAQVTAGAGLDAGTGSDIDHGLVSDADSFNSGTTVIQDVGTDGFGHVTSLDTQDLSSSFDDYGGWVIKEGNGTESSDITSGETLTIEGGADITSELSGSTLTITHDDNADPDAHHTRYSDSEARGAVKAGIDYVDFNNNEQSDYNQDGRVYWDLSAGLYVKSSNADHLNPALLWSSANVTAGSGISVSYDGEDFPYLSVNESQINHDSLSGISSDDHHSRYSDSEAISAINNDFDHGSTAPHNYTTPGSNLVDEAGTDIGLADSISGSLRFTGGGFNTLQLENRSGVSWDDSGTEFVIRPDSSFDRLNFFAYDRGNFLGTPFRVLKSGVEISGYKFQDSGDDLQVTTPAGNTITLTNAGQLQASDDVSAFS